MRLRFDPPIKIPSRLLSRINYNGMSGRLLHLPRPKKDANRVVVLSGQHAAHERMYSIAELLNENSEVYLPDLPGFGGMDSFFSVNMDASYNNYADYLYSFLKTNKLTSEVDFFATSFGAQVMTRMFQLHPDSVGWAKNAVAFVGFAGGSNFKPSWKRKLFLTPVIFLHRTRLGVMLMNLLVFNPLSLRLMLQIFSRFKAKMQSDDNNLSKEMIKMEGYLWSVNDRRTHGVTAHAMFTEHLADFPTDSLIDLELMNLITDNDQYFDNRLVEKDFKRLYRSYSTSNLNLDVHTPSMIADKEAVRKIIDPEVLELLAS